MPWFDEYEYAFKEEELVIRDVARSFAQNKISSLADKIDKEHYYPKELVQEMGKLGFLGVFVPEKYNGAGLNHIAYTLIIEEIAAECASTAVIASAHNSLCIWPILHYGKESQKEIYLSKLSTGEWIGCFALSEPGSGSDAAGLKCSVSKKGEKYIINGSKNWITNAPVADVCVLFATIDRSLGHKGVVAFVHSMDLKGISVGKKEDKLGICGSPTASINYDNVELSKDNLLGNERDGFKIAMNTLNGGRIGIAAQAVGIARSALNKAARYSTERESFGVKIFNHQLVQEMLANMATKIDAARFLTLSAANRKDKNKPHIRQAAMAKLFASETAMYCSAKAIQVFGGYGYVKEYPVERLYRDAKITEIYEGTSEIQKIVIASRLISELD